MVFKKVIILGSILLAFIMLAGQSNANQVTGGLEQLQRRQVNGVSNTDTDTTGPINALVTSLKIPVESVSFLSSGIAATVSSPLTLSGDLFNGFNLDASPIIGPLSGSLFILVDAIIVSPQTVTRYLCGGFEEVLDGIVGGLSSPLTISSQETGIFGVLSSPLEFLPALSGNLGDVASGILETLASPLVVSAQVIDGGTSLGVNSIGGNLLPESVILSLPGSASRGIDALINSPLVLSNDLETGYHLTLDGILSLVSSPLTTCAQVATGKITMKTEQEYLNVFPGESNDPLTAGLGALFESPLKLPNVISDDSGLILSGILTVLSSPLSLSGYIIDETLNTDVASPKMLPSQSDLGQPDSLANGVKAIEGSPITLCGTAHDGLHDFVNGVPGLLTSPLTVLSGDSPFPIPGSAKYGLAGLPESPKQLVQATSLNLGLTIDGLTRLLSAPITMSGEVLTRGFNINENSLMALPEELKQIGIPESVGVPIAAILKSPVQTLFTFLGTIKSPLTILTEEVSNIIPFNIPHAGDDGTGGSGGTMETNPVQPPFEF